MQEDVINQSTKYLILSFWVQCHRSPSLTFWKNTCTRIMVTLIDTVY